MSCHLEDLTDPAAWQGPRDSLVAKSHYRDGSYQNCAGGRSLNEGGILTNQVHDSLLKGFLAECEAQLEVDIYVNLCFASRRYKSASPEAMNQAQPTRAISQRPAQHARSTGVCGVDTSRYAKHVGTVPDASTARAASA
jgi:hypothetical protein